VVYNGLPQEEVNDRRRAALAAELNINPDRVVISCIARFTEQKGHRYLVEAVSLLPSALRDSLVILLAGDGTLREGIEQMVAQKGLEENFRFLGFRQEIPEILSLSAFTVMPSLWEGLPMTAIESFWQGKPVLGTTACGMPEVIINGQSGLLVTPKDSKALAGALEYFLIHEELWGKYGEAGRTTAHKNFSIEKMAHGYKQLYQMLMAR